MISPPRLDETFVGGDGKLLQYWKSWIDAFYKGDEGKEWTPAYTSLTESGTATHTGKYYRLSKNLYYFRVTITPATNTSSTAGTTLLNNFPLTIHGNGGFIAVNNTTNVAIGNGVIKSTGLYPPTWATVTAPITLSGMIEAR